MKISSVRDEQLEKEISLINFLIFSGIVQSDSSKFSGDLRTLIASMLKREPRYDSR